MVSVSEMCEIHNILHFIFFFCCNELTDNIISVTIFAEERRNEKRKSRFEGMEERVTVTILGNDAHL